MAHPTLTLVFKSREDLIAQFSATENAPNHIKLPPGNLKVVVYAAAKQTPVMDVSSLMQQMSKPAAKPPSNTTKTEPKKVISKPHKDIPQQEPDYTRTIPNKYRLVDLSVGDKIEYISPSAISTKRNPHYERRHGVVVSVKGKKKYALVRRWDEDAPKPTSAWNVDPRAVISITRNAKLSTSDRTRANAIVQKYLGEIDALSAKRQALRDEMNNLSNRLPASLMYDSDGEETPELRHARHMQMLDEEDEEEETQQDSTGRFVNYTSDNEDIIL